MRKSAFLALFLGTPFFVTACGDDSASGDGETGGDTDSTESNGTAPTTGPTTSQPDTGDTDETDSDDGGNGCTPEDQCMEDDDCLEGQTCLATCTCFGQGVEPECEFEGTGVYGDCVSGGNAACMGGGGQCVVDNTANPSLGVCYFSCNEACDCPAPPEGFESQVSCEALLAGSTQTVCIIDCAGGKACPDGMTCFAGAGLCVWGQGDEIPDYGDCINNSGQCENGVCVVDDTMNPTQGVCSPGCQNDASCRAPSGGDADPFCADFGGGNQFCLLDCTNGETCPDGMICDPIGGVSICTWEGTGPGGSCAGSCGAFDENASCQCDDECFNFGDCCDDICDECGGSFPDECTPPVPPDSYEDCANEGPAVCNEGEECVQAEDAGTHWGVCGVTGCANAGECPEAPATGDAPVTCGDLGDGNVCYLDCSNQQTCPDGMTCSSEGNCAYEGPGFALYEGFHGGQMPAGWTVLDEDGLTPDPDVAYVTDGWVVVDTIVNDYAAVSTSWYNPVGQADDWLITPPVMLGAQSVLSWKAYAPDANFPDGYEVRISTAGTAVADFLANAALFTIAAEGSAGYTHRTVDLAAAGYADVEVHIAFRNNTNDMFLLFVDDIAISQ